MSGPYSAGEKPVSSSVTDAVILESERLTLRPIRTDDAAAVHDYRSDPDVLQYLIHGPLELDEVRHRLTDAAEQWTNPDGERFHLTFAVEHDGEVIGDVHAWNTEELYQPEPEDPADVLIGYAFNPRHQGRGYATEAVGRLLAWLFQRGAARVYANTYAGNRASIRLLERLGFVQDEFLPAEQDESGQGLASVGLRLDRSIG
jgi:RimJ/RimL family protein N-acetyltransferase